MLIEKTIDFNNSSTTLEHEYTTTSSNWTADMVLWQGVRVAPNMLTGDGLRSFSLYVSVVTTPIYGVNFRVRQGTVLATKSFDITSTGWVNFAFDELVPFDNTQYLYLEYYGISGDDFWAHYMDDDGSDTGFLFGYNTSYTTSAASRIYTGADDIDLIALTPSIQQSISKEKATSLSMAASCVVHKQRPVCNSLKNLSLFTDSGLKALFKFEETGNATYDSKYGIRMNYIIGKAFDTGINGQCVSASGGTKLRSSIPAGGIEEFYSGTVNSISAWVKMTVISGEQILFSKYQDSLGYKLKFGIKDGRLYYYDYKLGSGFDSVSSDAVSVVPGIWNHICFTRSGTEGKFYLNGVEVGTVTASKTVTYSYYVYHFMGAEATSTTDATNYFNGCFDELSFWDRVLTPSEILLIAKNIPLNITNEVTLSGSEAYLKTIGRSISASLGLGLSKAQKKISNIVWKSPIPGIAATVLGTVAGLGGKYTGAEFQVEVPSANGYLLITTGNVNLGGTWCQLDTVSLTALRSDVSGDAASIYGVFNPTIGTHTIKVSGSDANYDAYGACATFFTGINPITPYKLLDWYVKTTPYPRSNSRTTINSGIIVDSILHRANVAITVGTGQTELCNLRTLYQTSYGATHAASYKKFTYDPLITLWDRTPIEMYWNDPFGNDTNRLCSLVIVEENPPTVGFSLFVPKANKSVSNNLSSSFSLSEIEHSTINLLINVDIPLSPAINNIKKVYYRTFGASLTNIINGIKKYSSKIIDFKSSSTILDHSYYDFDSFWTADYPGWSSLRVNPNTLTGSKLKSLSLYITYSNPMYDVVFRVRQASVLLTKNFDITSIGWFNFDFGDVAFDNTQYLYIEYYGISGDDYWAHQINSGSETPKDTDTAFGPMGSYNSYSAVNQIYTTAEVLSDSISMSSVNKKSIVNTVSSVISLASNKGNLISGTVEAILSLNSKAKKLVGSLFTGLSISLSTTDKKIVDVVANVVIGLENKGKKYLSIFTGTTLGLSGIAIKFKTIRKTLLANVQLTENAVKNVIATIEGAVLNMSLSDSKFIRKISRTTLILSIGISKFISKYLIGANITFGENMGRLIKVLVDIEMNISIRKITGRFLTRNAVLEILSSGGIFFCSIILRATILLAKGTHRFISAVISGAVISVSLLLVSLFKTRISSINKPKVSIK